MNTDIYVARGSERNIYRSVVKGVEKSIVESILGVSAPKESIDSFGYVHLWGVPKSGAEKYWRSIKRGDIIIILPVKKSRRELNECYITIVIDKYPINAIPEEIERSEKLSRVVWEPYRRKQGVTESYPYIVFLESRVSIESINNVLKMLGKDAKSLAGYRESIQRVRVISEQALQELIQRIYKVPDIATILSLFEEAYLELSTRFGWNPVNCYYYSTKYNVCYGAPIPLGNKEVWGREGLFEELNKKLVEKGFRPITWELLKQIIKSITRPGMVWASWFSSVYTKQVEPHDVTIMKPLTQEPQ